MTRTVWIEGTCKEGEGPLDCSALSAAYKGYNLFHCPSARMTFLVEWSTTWDSGVQAHQAKIITASKTALVHSVISAPPPPNILQNQLLEYCQGLPFWCLKCQNLPQNVMELLKRILQQSLGSSFEVIKSDFCKHRPVLGMHMGLTQNRIGFTSGIPTTV